MEQCVIQLEAPFEARGNETSGSCPSERRLKATRLSGPTLKLQGGPAWPGLGRRQVRGERHLGLLEPSRELMHPAYR